jgi:hypothetical protein
MRAFAPFSALLTQSGPDTEMDKAKAAMSGHFLCDHAAVAVFVITFEAQKACHFA